MQLDVRDIACPQNFARVIIALAELEPDDKLEIILRYGEPYENVKSGLEVECVDILDEKKLSDELVLLVVAKREIN